MKTSLLLATALLAATLVHAGAATTLFTEDFGVGTTSVGVTNLGRNDYGSGPVANPSVFVYTVTPGSNNSWVYDGTNEWIELGTTTTERRRHTTVFFQALAGQPFNSMSMSFDVDLFDSDAADNPRLGYEIVGWNSGAVDIPDIDLGLNDNVPSNNALQPDSGDNIAPFTLIANGNGVGELTLANDGFQTITPSNINFNGNTYDFIAVAILGGEAADAVVGTDVEHIYLDNIRITLESIPEPSAAALFGLAGFALVLRRRR